MLISVTAEYNMCIYYLSKVKKKKTKRQRRILMVHFKSKVVFSCITVHGATMSIITQGIFKPVNTSFMYI